MRPRCGLLLLALGGCTARGAPNLDASAGEQADRRVFAPISPASGVQGRSPCCEAALPPLTGAWLEKLELPSKEIAYVAPPLGSTGARPVIVAVHGAFDHPGAMCGAWRAISDAYAFVVCPSGTRSGKDAFTWASSDQITKASDAAVAAVRAKFGDRVGSGPAVYAAFSQGASMAGAVLMKGAFARAALTEGGYRVFEEPGIARAFTKAGGQRVLFTCSQGGCVGSFTGSKAALVQAGGAVKVETPGPFGHSMVPQVRESLHQSLPWLTEGLPGWEAYASHPKLPFH